jgi:hypothetical protein
VISIIELVLGLLGTVLASAKAGGLATEVITGIENAISELQTVQGTPVTYAQLEGLRVKPKW